MATEEEFFVLVSVTRSDHCKTMPRLVPSDGQFQGKRAEPQPGGRSPAKENEASGAAVPRLRPGGKAVAKREG